MNLNAYAQRKQSLIARMIRAITWIFQQFLTSQITLRSWDLLMHTLYRIVKSFRDEGTELARQFYDDNRAAETGAPRQDIYKDDYYPEEWMRETFVPTFRDLQRTGNVDAAIQDATNRAIKVVEDGARRTLIQGVVNDITQEVRGWARFDPRPPTCAFCTMMISRGPVYVDATNASLDLDNQSAEELMQNIDPRDANDETLDEIYALMNRWHPGCTCIVVPVYKRSGYATEKQERDALSVYNRARRATDDKTFKGILKKMRELARNPQEDQDEITLPASA